MRVAVVGGGLAGISCALALADRGARVTLVERSAVLGGLCRSVSDPVAGRVDTGQHVYLGCCTALEGLLARVGAEPSLSQPGLSVTVATKGGSARVQAARLPAPAHLAPVLLRWPGLGWRQRLAAAALARAAGSLGEGDLASLDAVPARGWLDSLGQDDQLVRRLWEPFLVAACNLPLERCSAGVAVDVIRRGLLFSRGAGAFRVPSTDLTRWLDPGSRTALARVGVRLRLRARVESLGRSATGWKLAVEGGDPLDADKVVLSTSARSAQRLLERSGLADRRVQRAAALGTAPIVNIHLFTDRPFLPGPVVVAPDSPLQWLFDRSRLDQGELRMAGSTVYHSAISLSAAFAEVGVAEQELSERYWRLCQTTFPKAVNARLQHVRVTREAAATFAAEPGAAADRPLPGTALLGGSVLLAGNWTDTGWPATMEGAVRSGAAAAASALGA